MSQKPSTELIQYLGIGLLATAVLVGGYYFSSFGTTTTGVGTGSTSGVPAASAPSPSSSPSPAAPPSLRPATETASVAPITEKLEGFDPAQALADAIRETDPELRRNRIMAVLKKWAALDPDAAARAAMAWPGDDRVDPIAAVLAGVAGKPDEALRLGTFFCREDPSWAPEHGRALIDALAQAGNYSAAVSFALVGGAEVDGEERNKWLTTAFSGWAQREPQLAALAAASDLPENGMRQEALIAVVAHWRQLNPKGPEKFLAQLPAGPERTALAEALAATSAH